MSSRFVDRMRHTLNNEVVRRLLIRYFVGKGYQNFDQFIYPPAIQDLPFTIPELADKVEILPHAKSIDPMMDSAELGWNVFVLGNQRQYLGETFHHGLHRLALQLQTGRVLAEEMVATRQTTPRRVVHFITRVLDSNKGGFVDLTPRVVPMRAQQGFQPQMGGANMSASNFFTRSGYGT